MATYDPAEIFRLYVFGTNTPSTADYNEHIRPLTANAGPKGSKPVFKTYDMQNFMFNGAGRFAYPSLFGAIDKVFEATISDGEYNYQQLKSYFGNTGQNNILDSDLQITISNYGTDIRSADFEERAMIFGNVVFKLDLEEATFTVVNGKVTINNMQVRADNDNFDFDSPNSVVEAINNTVLEPAIDPYNLGRGNQGTFNGQAIDILFSGEGRIYNGYSQSDYELDEVRDFDVSLQGGGFLHKENIIDGLSLLAVTGLPWLTNVLSAPFLSYTKDELKVIYGTPGADDLDPFDATHFNVLDVNAGYTSRGHDFGF